MSTAGLEIVGLHKSFGATTVLDGIEASFAPGMLGAILGPSGCGKTTLLRLVAGFETPDQGTITLGGRILASPGDWVPPHRRGIGYVPQDGALFPHLSVADNIGFGLDRRGRGDRVTSMLDLIGMAGLSERMPHQLSGGQQQRVALARALAPEPALVLLDEPFNALDATLRRTLCADVRRILRRSGAMGILVTHDRDEAFTMADQIVVMGQGRVVQAGPPRDMYRDPADLATAALVGVAVRLPGEARDGQVETALGRLALAGRGQGLAGPVLVMIRPEQIVRAADPGAVMALVQSSSFQGPLVWLDMEIGSAEGPVPVTACWPAAATTDLGERIAVRVDGPVAAYPAHPPAR